MLTAQRKLALLERQRALRHHMAMTQVELNKVADKDYRKFQTSVRSFIMAQDRAAQDAHSKLWGERMAAVREARSALSVAVRSLHHTATYIALRQDCLHE